MEALRLQLDTAQAELNLKEAENRRLREDRPLQATAIDTERELGQARQENERLTAELQQLRELYEQLLRGTREAEAEETPVAERCVALEREVTELQSRVNSETAMRAEHEQRVESLRGELREALEQAERQDEQCRQLETDLQGMQGDAELERLRVVAEETSKWERREARLLRQLEELEVRSTRGQTEATPVNGPQFSPQVVSSSAECHSGIGIEALMTPKALTEPQSRPITTVPGASPMSTPFSTDGVGGEISPHPL